MTFRPMSSVRLSLIYSFSERYASLAVSLGVTAILSRLLTPGEMGVFFVGMSIIGLTHVFRDLGVVNYIIQESDLSERRLRTAATILVAMSWTMGAFVALSGGYLASFYREPRLREMMWIAALNFLILPIAGVTSAQLRRDLGFAQIARANFAGTLGNAATAISLALLHFQFLSLAWGTVASTIASTTMLVYQHPRLGAFRPSLSEWKRILSFSSYSVATSLINELYRFAPDLILGRVLGFSAVGLYSRAVSLTTLFNRLVLDAVDPVVLPAVSAGVRSGQNIKAAYLLAIEHITVFYWPFLVGLGLMAGAIVRVLLGSQWLDAVPITRIVAFAALVNFPSFLTYPFLVALGRIRDTLVMSVIAVPISLALIVLALPYGLHAVALSSFVSLPLQLAVAQWFIRRQVGISISDIAQAAAKSAVVTAFASVVPAFSLLLPTSSFASALSTLALAASGALVGWIAGVIATNHPIVGEVRRAFDRGSQLFRQHVLGFR